MSIDKDRKDKNRKMIDEDLKKNSSSKISIRRILQIAIPDLLKAISFVLFVGLILLFIVWWIGRDKSKTAEESPKPSESSESASSSSDVRTKDSRDSSAKTDLSSTETDLPSTESSSGSSPVDKNSSSPLTNNPNDQKKQEGNGSKARMSRRTSTEGKSEEKAE